MYTRTQALWLPKRGNAESEYEDAFASTGDGTGGSCRWAVADGATEASYSRQWARALVRAFAGGTLRAATFAADVERMRLQWQRALQRHQRSRPQPWYAAQKASLGAFAALVGLELHGADADGPARWAAVAVGDSNLFLLRGGELVTAFPLTRADQFSNGPFLVGSNAPLGENPLARAVARSSGELIAGDVFVLASDALACWLLRGHERGERPWQQLAALPQGDAGPAAFAALVAELRADGSLHNDDVTCLRVEVGVLASTGTLLPATASTGQPGDGYWLAADETTPF